MAYFTDLEQIFQKFIWNQKRPQITSTILRKKNKAGGITIPDTKLYYKATVIKIGLAQEQAYRSIKWNRDPRGKPTPLQSVFDKGDKGTQWSNDSLFNKWCWEHWTGTCKNMKLDHQLTPHTRINSKQIRRLKGKS